MNCVHVHDVLKNYALLDRNHVHLRSGVQHVVAMYIQNALEVSAACWTTRNILNHDEEVEKTISHLVFIESLTLDNSLVTELCNDD